MEFLEYIMSEARSAKKTIVLPESGDRRVVEAAAAVAAERIAGIIMIGNWKKVRNDFPDIHFDGIQFLEPSAHDRFEEMAGKLHQLRKHKGMTAEQARDALLDPTTFGIMLLKMGLADGLVAGAVNTTADTLRPALQILKTRPGTKLVSAYMLMVVPDCVLGNQGMFLMSDCALNVNPTAEELAEIALASAESWRQLTGREPRVAMLSYSSKGSAKGEMPDKIIEATRLARERAPDLLIDGELQADAALVPEVAALKTRGSPVAGMANCLIFPDLNAGNIAYKLVQRLGKAAAYGPMLQGVACPVNDLSRGCTADDIVGVIALTAVQAIEAGCEKDAAS
ncbi:MAG TPA: phosphate acetyltransferase [Bacillota bacterium]|nr:phosphate acetyltransferase [Fastidiosipila sp.]HPX93920.1 phosphate acetyltransferase [Bacillota bacterium]HQB81836.1 phosphate acetyltransferase [Bacillota bacterium]